ncbi:hypothetical protein NLI96_g11462 [Meripilus lineatus]|uniref:Uncharacterized protein n=1 Tax=Meripilus lineatus TaxID=2056292 RepID=A0AAD5UWL8_9APHY|nr:hypothetical protein NLI96_g11462 [Physisporinus lineatus]
MPMARNNAPSVAPKWFHNRYDKDTLVYGRNQSSKSSTLFSTLAPSRSIVGSFLSPMIPILGFAKRRPKTYQIQRTPETFTR